MTPMKQSKTIAAVTVLAVVVILAAAAVALRSDKKTPAANPAASASTAANNSAVPQTTINVLIKKGRIINGPSEISVKTGQEIKMTAHGLGYGEGDNLVVEGLNGVFFELDELDQPTTVYFTVPKAGSYPMIVNTTNQLVGHINAS